MIRGPQLAELTCARSQALRTMERGLPLNGDCVDFVSAMAVATFSGIAAACKEFRE